MDVNSWDFALLGYGDQWRRCRRLFHEFLNVNTVSRFDDHLSKHACRLLSRLAETPDDFLGHTHLYVLPVSSVVIACLRLISIPSVTGALFMELTYGMDIKSHEDKFLHAAERAMNYLESAIVPGAFLVDTFPIRSSLNLLIFVTPG